MYGSQIPLPDPAIASPVFRLVLPPYLPLPLQVSAAKGASERR